MVQTRRSSGLTLVEVVVVLAVIIALVGLLVPTVSYARHRSQTARCVANLEQIAVATQLYYNDHHGPPLGSLPAALQDYVDSSGIFVCPKDRGSTDSYSAFYAARGEATSSQYVVGCPRHGDNDRGAVALGKGRCEDVVEATVQHNGSVVEPGEVVTGGELTFADGSKVTVAEGGQVGLLMSFTDQGACHSVIFVPKGSASFLRCEVTPGSRFEVVTPASIAGVEGTKFDVITGWEYDVAGNVLYSTEVRVYEGKVRVIDRRSGHDKVLPPGQCKKTKTHGRGAPDDPGKGNGKGNGGGNG
ncbi:MAG: FecR domain-containing protein, partial [Armatimonadetes bacterium]|nr:FecR domain-containing protein [Armatimonadota bacterium]